MNFSGATSRDTALASMHPAYFAVVMATGIVSVACHLLGFGWLARGMFWLNLIVYPTLWVLTLARLFVHRRRVAEDLLHHGRSVGFFTTVAATNVFGTQCLLIGGSPRAALALWVLGIALWMLLTYTIFTIITIKAEKPSLAEGISGAWLLGVVAAQSVSVLGAQLAPRFGAHAPHVLLFCLAMWLGGGMLYLWIISLIFYRYTSFVMGRRVSARHVHRQHAAALDCDSGSVPGRDLARVRVRGAAFVVGGGDRDGASSAHAARFAGMTDAHERSHELRVWMLC